MVIYIITLPRRVLTPLAPITVVHLQEHLSMHASLQSMRSCLYLHYTHTHSHTHIYNYSFTATLINT